MPRAKQKSSAGLSIELSDDRKYFTIGDKVAGDVVLDTAQDFAIGSVGLKFYGRVKVHFVQSHGHGESHWRGRTPLFSESVSLYQGYHTHKPGSFRWPFTFEIPSNPDISAIRQSKHQWQEKEHFLSTEDYIPAHPMPATFYYRKRGFGYRWHVFVEYVLEVEVRQAEGSRMLLPPLSRKATLPILVKEVSTENSNTHFLPLAAHFTLPNQLMKSCTNNSQSGQPQLTSQAFLQTVRSSRLTAQKSARPPMNARSSFSFKEKTKQVFNSSSLPRYTFEISVSTPQSIQLLRQDAVPFLVSVSTVRDIENTTIQPDGYPDIRIDNISIFLTAITHLRCKGPFGTRPTEFDIHLLDRQPVDYVLEMSPQRGVYDEGRSSTADAGDNDSADKAAARNRVDISKLPGLSIAVTAAKMGPQTEKPLSPSFSTYIIAREYKLKWKMELDVAGEKIKLQNNDDLAIKLLPPEPNDLNAIMQEGEVTGAESHGDEEELSGEDESLQSEKGSTSLSNLINLRNAKKTKQEEAAEDHGAPGPSTQPLQFRRDEMLPRYEPGPTDFGYRNEIDEGPPDYEKDKRQKSLRNRLSFGMRSAKDVVIA